MPTIGDRHRHRECNALTEVADAALGHSEHFAALQACIDHPCAYHELDLPELYRDLGEALSRMGRYDEALEACEAPIAAGAGRAPHPRALVAEVSLRAGRRAEADSLYADLRRQCPDDIWLRNAAGFAYWWAGDHAAAIPWLEAGIIDTGPFLTNSYSEASPDRSPGAHCVWDPEAEPPGEVHLDEHAWSAAQQRRSAPATSGGEPLRVAKVGRDAPCPCGSGRKHKNCCGR